MTNSTPFAAVYSAEDHGCVGWTDDGLRAARSIKEALKKAEEDTGQPCFAVVWNDTDDEHPSGWIPGEKGGGALEKCENSLRRVCFHNGWNVPPKL
jgi:hypothetical protein